MDVPYKNHTWPNIYNHYSAIKSKHNLTSSDIFKQLSSNYSYANILYLSTQGTTLRPSSKKGTIGRRTWDILINNISKTDWTPSIATYEDKLLELSIDNKYPHIDAIVTDDCDPNYPALDIDINLSELPHLCEDILQQMFTIDRIVPTINNISYFHYL